MGCDIPRDIQSLLKSRAINKEDLIRAKKGLGVGSKDRPGTSVFRPLKNTIPWSRLSFAEFVRFVSAHEFFHRGSQIGI